MLCLSSTTHLSGFNLTGPPPKGPGCLTNQHKTMHTSDNNACKAKRDLKEKYYPHELHFGPSSVEQNFPAADVKNKNT